MKLLTFAFFIFAISSGSAFSIEKLAVHSVSNEAFEFDHKVDYLNLNVSALYPPIENVPPWWDRLLGKNTNFGLVYIEYENTKIPLFSYSAVSNRKYEVDTIGVLKDKISYPVVRNLPYSLSNTDKVKITVHYWEDPAKAEVIKRILSAAQLLGGMDAAAVDKATNISTTAVTLIENLWPSKDQKKTAVLSLIRENISRKNITFGHPNEEGRPDPVLTIEFNSRKGYFVGKPLEEALNEFKADQIDVWRSSIVELDNHIAATGVAPVINQITLFSSYLSRQQLNYADKVLFLAKAIDNWASNSIKGVTTSNGQSGQFTMANYRKLPNSDWEFISRQPDNILEGLSGSNRCNTGQCKKLSNFVSQASAGFDIANYLAPTVSVTINGEPSSIKREDFKNSVSFKNDNAWTTFRASSSVDDQWIAKYSHGLLKIMVAGKYYKANEVEIAIIRVGEDYFIQSISIK